MTVLLAACGSTPAPITGTVVGGGGDGEQIGWLDVAPCSWKIASWADVEAYCDLSKLQTVVLADPTELQGYARGDQYPKGEPTPLPSYLDPNP